MGPVTRLLIALNVAVFVLQQSAGNALIATFALWPTGSHRVPGYPVSVEFEPAPAITGTRPPTYLMVCSMT